MRTHTRLLLGALAAALVLASAVSTASAGRLSTTSQTFRQVWQPLTFATSPGEGGATIRCNVTLEGSFHYRSIVKQARSLIGFVTRAAIAHPCAGGEAWALNGVERATNSLPWHLTYEAFEGTLPAITGVRLLLRAAFQIEIGLGLCLYEGNAQGVAKLTRSVITNILPDNTVPVARKSGGFFCPGSGFFSQEGGAVSATTVLGAATQITVTLI